MTGALSEAEVRVVNLIEVGRQGRLGRAPSPAVPQIINHVQLRGSGRLLLSHAVLTRSCLVGAQVLAEEAEEEGRQVPRPPEDAYTWPEDAIRAYFASGGTALPKAEPAKPPAPRLPPADPETFRRWFPGLGFSRTACAAPALRVLCFPNAGNAEDMYTSEGTGARRAPSPLLEWCRQNAAECLAPQYPGRGMRMQEPRVTRAADMAAALLPVVASQLYDVPWVLVAHSVGTWIGYEFLRACAAAGVPPPRAVFLSAMPAPTLPPAARPWRRQRTLGEADFKDECRGWDIAEVVFSPGMWPTYHPLLRDDFTLFDEYDHVYDGAGPVLRAPVLAFWGTRDRRVTREHVEGWGGLCAGPFRAEAVEGNHLWPADRGAKADWLGRIVAEMEALGVLG